MPGARHARQASSACRRRRRRAKGGGLEPRSRHHLRPAQAGGAGHATGRSIRDDRRRGTGRYHGETPSVRLADLIGPCLGTKRDQGTSQLVEQGNTGTASISWDITARRRDHRGDDEGAE